MFSLSKDGPLPIDNQSTDYQNWKASQRRRSTGFDRVRESSVRLPLVDECNRRRLHGSTTSPPLSASATKGNARSTALGERNSTATFGTAAKRRAVGTSCSRLNLDEQQPNSAACVVPLNGVHKYNDFRGCLALAAGKQTRLCWNLGASGWGDASAVTARETRGVEENKICAGVTA